MERSQNLPKSLKILFTHFFRHSNLSPKDLLIKIVAPRGESSRGREKGKERAVDEGSSCERRQKESEDINYDSGKPSLPMRVAGWILCASLSKVLRSAMLFDCRGWKVLRKRMRRFILICTDIVLNSMEVHQIFDWEYTPAEYDGEWGETSWWSCLSVS